MKVSNKTSGSFSTKENKYKWMKPKSLFVPKIKYLVDAWWKELKEGLEKIRRTK